MTEKFEKQLTSLINRHNIDTRVNMPDWVIAKVICINLDDLQALHEEQVRELHNKFLAIIKEGE